MAMNVQFLYGLRENLKPLTSVSSPLTLVPSNSCNLKIQKFGMIGSFVLQIKEKV